METIDVSVVIPTYNKKDFLEITLTALGLQTYPPDKYEVVIINDGSTDATETLVASLKMPYQINYTRQENKGSSAARNRGIEQAKGETIIFIDDDCIPSHTFIERHMRFHRERDNFSVIGYRYHTFFKMLSDSSTHKGALIEQLKRHKVLHPLLNVPENTALIRPEDIRHNFDKIVQLSYRGERDRWEQAYDTYTADMNGFVLPWLLFVTSNVSVKKHHLGRQMEIFDENFRGWGLEDFEMGYRLYKRGLRFVLDKASIIHRLIHWDNETEDRLASKVRNYIHFCKKHPCLEVYLYWCLSTGQFDVCTYNVLVRQYYELLEKGSSVAEDYYRLVKHHCEQDGWNLEYRREKGN